jgi:hypothetical protein
LPGATSVSFCNDADAFVLGEWWAGAARGHCFQVGPRTARRGTKARPNWDHPHRGRRETAAQVLELAVDALVAPDHQITHRSAADPYASAPGVQSAAVRA